MNVEEVGFGIATDPYWETLPDTGLLNPELDESDPGLMALMAAGSAFLPRVKA